LRYRCSISVWVIVDQLAPGFPFGGVAEGVESRAAQELEPCRQSEASLCTSYHRSHAIRGNRLVIKKAERFVVASKEEAYIFQIAAKRKKARSAT